MKRYFIRKLGLYFNYWSTLLFSSVILFSCTNKIYQYKSECELGGSTGNNATDPGNYFYIMTMSKEDFIKLSKPHSLRRFIFQFKNIKSENGRNEYEIGSYAWNKGKFSKEMFLIREYKTPVLWVDPREAFSFVNLEIRKKNIKQQEAFSNTDSISLIPYFDKCKKVMSLKIVSSSKMQNDNSYRETKIRTNPDRYPNYAISAGYKIVNNGLQEGQFPEEQLMRFLDLPSELEVNPCPPDIPQGK
jgi:hypothetical protein